MFATADFNFDLTQQHSCQFISHHCTTNTQEWDKYHAHPGMEFIFVHEGQGSVIIDQNIYAYIYLKKLPAAELLIISFLTGCVKLACF